MTDPIKAEPVAWMYSSPHGVETTPDRYAEREGYTASNWRGWTETPLYTHAQLVEERRLAWNEAIEAAAKAYETGIGYAPGKLAAKRIRALTKDSTS